MPLDPGTIENTLGNTLHCVMCCMYVGMIHQVLYYVHGCTTGCDSCGMAMRTYVGKYLVDVVFGCIECLHMLMFYLQSWVLRDAHGHKACEQPLDCYFGVGRAF